MNAGCDVRRRVACPIAPGVPSARKPLTPTCPQVPQWDSTTPSSRFAARSPDPSDTGCSSTGIYEPRPQCSGESEPFGGGDCFVASVDVEFAVDVAEMRLQCVPRDVHGLGDLERLQPRGEIAKDLELSLR